MTVVDFFIYDLIYLMDKVMPEQVQQFPKLHQIHLEMAALPSIKNYEMSKRAIKHYCPIEFFDEWKKSAFGSSN